jgi:hypothetical protein
VVSAALLVACGEVRGGEDDSADASAGNDEGSDDTADTGEQDAGGGQEDAGSSEDAATTGQLTVVNDASFWIDEIRLAEPASKDWGPNLVPDGGIPPGTTVPIEVDCGVHDALIVGETGKECGLFEVELCGVEWSFETSSGPCPI